MSALGDVPPVNPALKARIRRRLGLDRTYVANRCPRCGRRLVDEFDRGEYSGELRHYLECVNPDCNGYLEVAS